MLFQIELSQDKRLVSLSAYHDSSYYSGYSHPIVLKYLLMESLPTLTFPPHQMGRAFKLNDVRNIYIFIYLLIDWFSEQCGFGRGSSRLVHTSGVVRFFTNLSFPSEDRPTSTTNMAKDSCCSSCARLRCWSHTCMNLLLIEWADLALQEGKVNTRTGEGKDCPLQLGQRQKTTTICWQHRCEQMRQHCEMQGASLVQFHC